MQKKTHAKAAKVKTERSFAAYFGCSFYDVAPFSLFPADGLVLRLPKCFGKRILLATPGHLAGTMPFRSERPHAKGAKDAKKTGF